MSIWNVVPLGVLWTICRERDGKMFEGVEFPLPVIKQFYF